jgi:hypothetical protein
MIHIQGIETEFKGGAADLLSEATFALAGAVIGGLEYLQDNGAPDEELESAMNNLIAVAGVDAKKVVREYLKEHKEEPCEEEEKGGVPEL